MTTEKARQAYELIRGEPYPEHPRPQDEALAELCLHEYQRQRREWQAQERRAVKYANAISGPLLPGGRAAIPLEREEQVAAARYLDALELVWIHVPNEGKRSKRVGASLLDQGLKPGFPDIVIFTPPPAHPHIRFVAVELKRQRGGRLTRNQGEWQHELRECGGIAEVCAGADELVALLKRLGYREGLHG